MEKPDYAVIVERLTEDEGGGFIAVVPDLPGCVSDGHTDIEALENVHDAISVWLEQARRMGRPIPKPSFHRRVA